MKGTFEHVVDVVLVVVNAHHVVDVAAQVAEPVLGDDDIWVVESILDPLQRVPHAERRDLQPAGARSVATSTFHAIIKRH